MKMQMRTTGFRPYVSEMYEVGMTMPYCGWMSISETVSGRSIGTKVSMGKAHEWRMRRTEQEAHEREDGLDNAGIKPDALRVIHHANIEDHLVCRCMYMRCSTLL